MQNDKKLGLKNSNMLIGSPKKKNRSLKSLNITLAVIGVIILSSIVYSPFIPKNITVKTGEVSYRNHYLTLIY